MVKSPWRLLTGLLSRGTPADRREGEGPGADASAFEASRESESTTEPDSSAALQAGEDAANARQGPTPSMAVDVPDALPADEATASVPDLDVVIIGVERRSQRSKAPSTTRRKTKADVSVHAKDAEPANALAEPSAASEPDPVRALDSEIRELRSQLAGKLRLQNDQLRRMLRRFEPK
jgi:hypothetical protein